MEYTVEVTIDLPRDRVIELFDSSENLHEWQDGLQSFEHIEGEPGQPGAKSRLMYEMGNRKVEMIETIEKRALPDEFTAVYEAGGVWNRAANRFYEEGDGTTRWLMDTEFKFSGFMKVISVFMRGSFPKETRGSMESFKAFAEGQDAGSG